MVMQESLLNAKQNEAKHLADSSISLKKTCETSSQDTEAVSRSDHSAHRPVRKTSAKLSLAAQRLYRRRALNRLDQHSRQVRLGRPNQSCRWCGVRGCEEEGALFERPWSFIELKLYSKHRRLPVKTYIKDFTQAMVDALYPRLQEERAKTMKAQTLEWFINSPPVMMAYWYFKEGTHMQRISTVEAELRQAICEAQSRFLEINLSSGSEESINMIHKYAKSHKPVPDKEWTLKDYTLRFMLCVEIWRQYGKYRWNDWSFGSPERAVELLTALLYNFCIMNRDKCFVKIMSMTDRRWDEAWEQWLNQNPILLGQDYLNDSFVPRQAIEGSEEDVLEEVGYLGGVGSYVPVWTQRPEHEARKEAEI